MATASRRQKLQVSPVLLGGLAVAAVLAAAAWFFLFRSTVPRPSAPTVVAERLDTAILADARFASLIRPRVLPIVADNLGRTNPFAPLAPVPTSTPVTATATATAVATGTDYAAPFP